MPSLKAKITGFIPGDDLSRRITITFATSGFPTGTTISKAWLTIKANVTDADPGLVQKAITTTEVVGTGQIENNGAGDTDIVLRFDLVPADTVAIGTTERQFDVQVKTADGKIYTPERGTIKADAEQITQSSA